MTRTKKETKRESVSRKEEGWTVPLSLRCVAIRSGISRLFETLIRAGPGNGSDKSLIEMG